MAHSHHGPTPELLDTQLGLRVIKVTFFALLATSVVEAVIAFFSHSAGLLADTVHSLSNTFTTLPLWIAFALSRRRATQQYPYGFYRAEDLAGMLILMFIAASAVLVGYQSIDKLLSDDEPRFLALAMAAGAVGFLVNEAVAQYRIKVGKRIESAAIVADGQHARVDGLGSLAVVIGLAVVALGYPKADPIAGLVITVLILYLLVREAAPGILSRVLDRIDPHILNQIREVAQGVPRVERVSDVRARWMGHSLLAELSVGVEAGLSVAEGHAVAEEVEHQLLHHISKLQRCQVHVEPSEDGSRAPHDLTDHHFGNEPDTEGEDHPH